MNPTTIHAHSPLDDIDLPEQCDQMTDPLSKFELTESEVEGFMEPEFAYTNFSIKGHMSVIAAEPNAGKTALAVFIAGQIAKSGCEVIYVNVDVAASDAKQLYRKSKEPGQEFRLLTPDLKLDQTPDDVLAHFKRELAAGTDFTNIVLFLDTLKKFVDVVNKHSSKQVYKLFRKLTGRGMTIICLAHTNKYPGPDGKPIFEGTGDLRADFDELIYLASQKDDRGGRRVSTMPDKVRGHFTPISFYIDRDRNVTTLDEYQDLAQEAKFNAEFAKDEFTIEAIRDAITGKKPNQKDIISHCKNEGHSIRTTRKVLRRYDGRLWKSQKGCQRNSLFYALCD